MNVGETILHDLLIIGGGPAGMSAALVAGRCRLRTVVVNEEKPRNAVTTASHGFLTRDGAHPMELLGIAKQQLAKYPSVRYLNHRVTAVSPVADGFEVGLSEGSDVRAKRIILATGYRDDLASLELPGVEAVYGKTVYPCPFCDGFEHSDQRIALFGADGVEHYAPLIRMWTDDLVVFTNGRRLTAEVLAVLESNAVAVYQQRIEQLHSEEGALRTVELEGGVSVERDAGFLWDDAGKPCDGFAEQLGVSRAPSPWGGTMLNADENGKTNIDGLYVVGDARTGFSGLMFSASEGGGCVEQIVHELSLERWNSVEDA